VASIRSRPGGRWQVRWRGPDGRQTAVTLHTRRAAMVYAATLEDAGEAAAWHAVEHLPDPDAPPPLTLDAWAERRIAATVGITEGTRAGYRRLWARTWSPLLGDTSVGQLTRQAVGQAVVELAGRLSDKSVANAHGLLSSILTAAVEEGLLSRHPSRGLRLPRRTEHQRQEIRALSPVEFARLLDCMPARWRPLLVLLAGTGLRWGEAAALQVGDVDVARRTLRVVRARKEGVGNPIGPTKTRRSRRTVVLPAQVLDAIAPLLAGRASTDPLFHGARGGSMDRQVVHRTWRVARAAAGLPGLRIHDLRHTHASWLIAAGVPLPEVSRRLGHETITTTVDVYGHMAPDLQASAAAAADRALLGGGPVELD